MPPAVIRKQHRCSFSLSFIFIFLILISPGLQPKACAEEPISASGSAPLSGSNAHDQALQAAFRIAIEQKVGVQVTSDTRIKNAEILSDEIYTYSEGFVERYEITGKNVENGILTLNANIWVGANRLNKALFLNGLDVKKVYAWVGEPRVLIMIQEYVDGELSSHSLAATELENLFREKGLRVFRREDTAGLAWKEQNIAFDDADQAVQIGRRSETEIVVLGRCLADHSRTLKIGQFEMNFYTARLSVRALNTSTGEVLLSGNYSSDPKTDTSALGKSDAAVNAIASCIHASKADILFKIVRNWYDGFTRPTIHQLTIQQIDYAQLLQLKIRLRTFDGVRNVFERSYENSVARLDIKYEGLQDQLVDDLLGSKLPLTILRKEQNLLILEHR